VPSTRAKVKNIIRKRYALGLATCRELRDFAEDLGCSWTGRALNEQLDGEHVAAAIFARTATTFGASLQLTSVGLADQAAMLNRALFEDLCDCGWCLLYIDETAPWINDHNLHRRMLLADAARSPDAFGAEIDVPAFDEAERKRLDDMFGKHGQWSWNGKQIHEKAAEIEQLFSDPSDVANLRFYRRIVHKQNNGLLHMGSGALAQIALGRDDEAMRMRVGPQVHHISEALLAGYWTTFQTTRLIVEHFEFPAHVHERLAALRQRLGELTAE
jgi:hypothetical protein